MRSPVPLAVVPQPPDTDTKYIHAIDATNALDKAIEEQKEKRRAAEFELVESFAQEVCTTANLNVAEAAFRRNEAWRVANERFQQQTDALENMREKINNNIDRLRTDCSDAVNSVLNQKLEALKKALCEEEASAQSLKEEIKNLEAEIKKTPSPAAKKR